MKLLLLPLLLLPLLLSGCVRICVEGPDTKWDYCRVGTMELQDATITYDRDGGFKATLGDTKGTPEGIEDIAESTAKGIVEGLK